MKTLSLLLFITTFVYGQDELKYITNYPISPVIGYVITCVDNKGTFQWGPQTGGAVSIVAHGDSVAQTIAVDTICSFTPSTDATLRIGGYINITAILNNILDFRIRFTDTHSTVQDFAFTLSVAGNLSSVNFVSFTPFDIRAKAGTIVRLYVTVSGIGNQTYDVGGNIMKLY